MTDKGLISKIYKQFIQLNHKKSNNPIEIWVGILKTYFFNEYMEMTKRDMKTCSTLLVLEKCKPKLQWGTTSVQSEWPSLKSH